MENKNYYHTLGDAERWCPVCGLPYPIRLVDDLHSIYMCYNCGHRDILDLFLEEPWYDTMYVYGVQPIHVPLPLAEKSVIPSSYLIFNAHRELLGSAIYDGGRTIGYLKWYGKYRNGRWYAAVSVHDYEYIVSNVKNGAVRIKFVNDVDVMAWAKEYYAEYEDNMADYTPQDMVDNYIRYMNKGV